VRRPLAVALVVLVPLLAGCGSNRQSALAPHSKPAREISTLFWQMTIGGFAGLGLVVVLLVLAWLRRRRRVERDQPGEWLVVGGGIALPIVVLATLFVVSDVFLIRDTQAPAAGATAMTVEVVGHRWFWTASYPGTKAVVADEIHIPVGTPIELDVRTTDVIHSFWVPELNRKIDTIPGRTNRILLRADTPGVFRGACAEFCGLQHANMSFVVVAEPAARFRAWLAGQSRPARPPMTAAERRGQHVFLAGSCSSCHTIRGTSASGDVGPDLTHLATRSYLAGLVLPNRPADLARWVAHPQQVKPGSLMPDLPLGRAQLADVVAYLDGLR
jgi:cytochrome c oxidase subunit II